MSTDQESGRGPSRRGFLAAGSGLVAAGLAGAQAPGQDLLGKAGSGAKLPPPVELSPLFAPTEKKSGGPPTALPPDRRLGYAIVGLGHLSLEQILPGIVRSQRSRPAALVSGDPAKARQVARQYGVGLEHLYDYKTFDRIKDDPAVDVVYIVLPNGMHPEYTERAAAAGKHVLCEKPMANSARDCERMISACSQAGKTLMIAYRCQYEPYNRALTDLARSRALGPVRMIAAENVQNQGDPSQWRHDKALAGGGALPDIGIYCLNAARYLTGEEPVEVVGQISTDPGDPRFREVEDRVSFTLRFPSGVLATGLTAYSAHESRRLKVFCEAGTAELDPAFAYNGLRMRVSRAEGASESVAERKLDPADQFALEIDHMSLCVAEGRRPRTPGEEGLQDQRVMEAVYESAREGRPVKMPPVAGLDAFRGPALS